MLVHGYLLSQTGSNLYTKYLARELCRAGNDVELLSQDDKVMDLDFVENSFRFTSGNGSVSLMKKQVTKYSGKCTAFQADIGGLLPVFVKDDYEGFKVKTFLELSGNELRGYLNANLTALKWLINNRDIDVMQLNHGVIFPYIASRIAPDIRPPCIIVIHGSGIEFIVKKSAVYRRYALIGLRSATKIIAVSQYVKDLIINIFGRDLAGKIELIPAGVDLSNFTKTNDRKRSMSNFQGAVSNQNLLNCNGFSQEIQGEMLKHVGHGPRITDAVKRIHQSYNDRRADADLAKKLATLSVNDKIILFVGKIMASKGVHLAIAALPLVVASETDVKLVVVGFGEERETLELLIDALSGADNKSIKILSKSIDNKISHRPYLSSFFNRLRVTGKFAAYLNSAVGLRRHIIFTGLLGHGETGYLEQLADIQLVVSLLPEAFGLVVLEGVACGAIPIIANHSGLRDLAEVLENESHLEKGLLRVDLKEEKTIFDLSAKIKRILSMPQTKRDDLSERLSRVPLEKYGWNITAAKFIDLYRESKRAA